MILNFINTFLNSFPKKFSIVNSWLFFLIFNSLIFANQSLAQSPIKPSSTTPTAPSPMNPTGMNPGIPNPTAPSAMNNPAGMNPGIPNPTAPSAMNNPAGMNPAMNGANPPSPSAMNNQGNPPNQNYGINQLSNDAKTLGQISAESISNSISKILGDNSTITVPVLMFNDQEIANINRALDSLKNNQIFVPEGLEKIEEKPAEEDQEKKEESEVEENEKSYIYLGSLIYFTPSDWVIWLNDQKISTSTNDPQKEIYVTKVLSDRINVKWKMSLTKWKILSGKRDETQAPRLDFNSNIVESEFELRPNQTFILGSNSVVEGKAVIALIKKKESKDKSSAKRTPGSSDQSSTGSQEQSSPIVNGSSGILSTVKSISQMNKQLDENVQEVR
jgi:hypothetical protein